MPKLPSSSELQEAVGLLGAIAEDVRRTPGHGPRDRGARLERALAVLCRKPGLRGAAMADESGLPLALHQFPLEQEAAGAVASILARALQEVAGLSGHPGADTVSVELAEGLELRVHRLRVGEATFFLLLACAPGKALPRAELERALADLRALVAP